MPSEALMEAAAGIQNDEERIKNRYKNNIGAAIINVAIIFGVAYSSELKWVIATGFALTIVTIGAQDANISISRRV